MATSTCAIATTPAEFLAWENQQRLRWELVGSAVRVMTGGTVGHNLLAGRALTALRAQLRRGYMAHQSDLKGVSPSGTATYPSAVVRCGWFDEGATEVDDPVLIVEIRSHSASHEYLISKRYWLPSDPVPELDAGQTPSDDRCSQSPSP